MPTLDPSYDPPPRQLVPGSVPARGSAPATDGNGVHWACQRCTNCCRWPGEVRLEPGEAEKIAAFLQVPDAHFIQDYTEIRDDRRGLRLRNLPSGACVMLKGADCRIQGAKPRQCSGFPNTWNFPGWRDVCEAVPLRLAHDGTWVRVEV